MFRFLLCVTCFFVAACDFSPKTTRLSGETMGTSLNIILVDIPYETDVTALESDIYRTLDHVDDLSSNWNPNSEISRINAKKTTNPISVSSEMIKLIEIANTVHRESNGAFDTTLAPLIELWGFGKSTQQQTPPSPQAIDAAMATVGQTKTLSIDMNRSQITKRHKDMTIHLAGYAKGYGIDELARTVETYNIENYYIEIGGDLIVSGQSERGDNWRVGIERPAPGLSNSIEHIVQLSDHAMATSGDYRNFFTNNGVRYSHILDPQTGAPITHATTSVTVISDSAVLADAWATALLVLGSQEGVALSNKLELASFFIDAKEVDGIISYETKSSTAFDALQTNN